VQPLVDKTCGLMRKQCKHRPWGCPNATLYETPANVTLGNWILDASCRSVCRLAQAEVYDPAKVYTMPQEVSNY